MMLDLKPKVRASIVTRGMGESLYSASQDITVMVSGNSSPFTSTFEIGVPSGFDTGAHYHTRTEELFYITEGTLLFMAFVPVRYTDNWFDWIGINEESPVLCKPGTLIHVPNYTPHAFANISSQTSRMIFQASPPSDHEEYFRGLTRIFNQSSVVDSDRVSEHRKEHDVHQITPLRFLSPDDLNSLSRNAMWTSYELNEQ